MKWYKFSEKQPDCKCIWFTDFKDVYLKKVCCLAVWETDEYAWAEANIAFPEVPIEILHSCIWMKTSNDWFFHQLKDGRLEMVGPNRVHDRVIVKFCPFCGFTLDKK